MSENKLREIKKKIKIEEIKQKKQDRSETGPEKCLAEEISNYSRKNSLTNSWTYSNLCSQKTVNGGFFMRKLLSTELITAVF